MKLCPTDVIHFIGIGGIGMSSLARLLYAMGYSVQGCDRQENDITRALKALGLNVYHGHDARHLETATIAVYSSAIPPQVRESLAQTKIAFYHRSELLAAMMASYHSIAVSGTHGKTTTTALVAHLLETAGWSPTVVNGGIIQAYQSNAHFGHGAWMVLEADESDGSFLTLSPTFSIITNITPDHLNHHRNFHELVKAFQQFSRNSLKGSVVWDEVAFRYPFAGPVLSYGFDPRATICGKAIVLTSTHSYFDVTITQESGSQTFSGIALPLLGRHNILNALAIIGIGRLLEIPFPQIQQALETFTGVQRRFTVLGEVNDILIINDHAHHPIEIQTVLNSAQLLKRNRVIAVFQPHRYTRLKDPFPDFCKCFDKADIVIVTEVDGAGEAPVPYYTKESIARASQACCPDKPILTLQSPEDLPQTHCRYRPSL